VGYDLSIAEASRVFLLQGLYETFQLPSFRSEEAYQKDYIFVTDGQLEYYIMMR
jgi:hypothetical protein